MNFKRGILMTILALCSTLVVGCGNKTTKKPKPTYEKVESSSLYVKKVENLSEDFMMGMDASSVISLENSGVSLVKVNKEVQ